MSNKNWYRNEVWNDEIEKSFMEKLNKTRSKKTQYIKIQSFYLLEKYPTVVLNLIKYSRNVKIDEFWEQEFCLYESKSYFALKEFTLSLQKAVESIEWRRKKPGVQTENIYWISELVLRTEERNEYKKCIEIMKEMHRETPFPKIEYKFHGFTALLLNRLGYINESITESVIAIEWANKDKNLLNNSRKLKYGLLKNNSEWPYMELVKLSNKNFA